MYTGIVELNSVRYKNNEQVFFIKLNKPWVEIEEYVEFYINF